MWQNGAPVYAELDGKFVGLRFSAKAANWSISTVKNVKI
jgi:hypothetical protein